MLANLLNILRKANLRVCMVYLSAASFMARSPKYSQKLRILIKDIKFALEKVSEMEIKFDKEYLSELYYKGYCHDKKHRFQPDIARRYQRCIDLMESVQTIESLYKYNSLNYKILSGEKQGISSVRVSNQYRLEFTVNKVETEMIVTICNILELSNHYK